MTGRAAAAIGGETGRGGAAMEPRDRAAEPGPPWPPGSPRPPAAQVTAGAAEAGVGARGWREGGRPDTGR